MLVVKMEVNFIKKATGTILFTCEDGEMIQSAINESIATKSSASTSLPPES
jgi:hypothetical protein